MGTRGRIRVGTSGWQYDHWKGLFYPDDLPTSRWFAFYSQHFDTVEVNNTFYHLPGEATFDAWREHAPGGFCYALKFSRYGTQMKKLKDPDATIGNFMVQARRLGPLLGPILVQLPPRWKPNVPRLRAFLDAAPSDIRWAVEFRDAAWLSDDVFSVLRQHNAALVIHDKIRDHPREVTADWVYLRFHGVDYAHNYSSEYLAEVAVWMRRQLDEGLDAYAYFNNDAHAYAIQNAMELRRLTGP